MLSFVLDGPKTPPSITKLAAAVAVVSLTAIVLDGNVHTSEFHTPGQYGTYAAMAQ